MKKLLLVLLLSCSVSASIGVKVLEDKSTLQQDGDKLTVTIHQVLGGVPELPALKGFYALSDRPDKPTFWQKVGFFFEDAYKGFTWRKAAYCAGGALGGLGCYKLGKKARKEHYVQKAKDKISVWVKR